MNPIAGAFPHSEPGWPRPTVVESDDELMPIVLVCGTHPDDLREVRHELTRAWRRAGQPITVCVSMWEARHPVGREAHAWAAEHRCCGIRFQPVTTHPGRVADALVFGPARYPAAGWIPRQEAA